MAKLTTCEQWLNKLPTNPDQNDLLDGFLNYIGDLGLSLYETQEEAILELFAHNHVILNTPTGSGKSMVAMAMAFMAMAEHKHYYYTCPIKALVNEKFFDLCEVFGAVNVGLLTGDGAVNGQAPLICCTAEILSQAALRDPNLDVDYVVMDEFHFYGDQERGTAWQVPLITLANTAFLLMSATLGNTDSIAEALEDFTKRPVSKVMGGVRPVPLDFSYQNALFHEAVKELVDSDKAPVYLVNFTKRDCAERAQGMTCVSLITKENRQNIGEFLADFRFDTPYGKELQRFIRSGVGIHHSALLPKYRRLVERLAQKGLLKVISGTDSLGVGVNVPIRSVLFSQLSKWDGKKSSLLSARQFHQIAGRAGRRGYDDIGYVVALPPEHIVENARIDLKIAKQPHLKNKLVKKQPPKGFLVWDENFYKQLIASEPEALTPVMNIDHGMVLSSIQSDGSAGYGRLIATIRRSQLSKGGQRNQIKKAALLAKSLLKANVVQIVPNPDGSGKKTFQLRPGLQNDFGLNATLALFLVDACKLLDMQAPEYPLMLLSLVECVCENPNEILYAQERKYKDKMISQWKAEGIPYEERMERLEELTYPKPNADQFYNAFNNFRAEHPWCKQDTIQPKTIARDMLELGCDFNNYIVEYGLERVEGLLLRYLSEVIHVCEQSVPQQYVTPDFQEIVTYLRTLVRHVDSTLLNEWEEMVNPDLVRPEEEKLAPLAKVIDVARDRQAFERRLRSEVRLLLQAIGRQDLEQISLALLPGSSPFKDEKDLAAFMAPFYAEYSHLNYGHRAILKEQTLIREKGPRCWTISQVLLDDEGATEFNLRLEVDLNMPHEPDLPLIQLIALDGDL